MFVEWKIAALGAPEGADCNGPGMRIIRKLAGERGLPKYEYDVENSERWKLRARNP
jgi:hypothetical protein